MGFPLDPIRSPSQLALLCTAAHTAAASLAELFPGITLLGGELTSTGFLYRFNSTHTLPDGAETLVAEKMRKVVRENRLVKNLEMVPCSASALLMKTGQADLAAQIEEEEGLVSIAQIGSFFDLGLGPLLQSTKQIGAFCLWPIQDLGEGELALSGCAFPTKEELNSFLKKMRENSKAGHIQIGKALGFWKEWDGQLIYLEKGLKEKAALQLSFCKEFFEQAKVIATPFLEKKPSFYRALASKMGDGVLLGEAYTAPRLQRLDPNAGLFSEEGGDTLVLFGLSDSDSARRKVISCLQRIGKTLNIMGFPYSVRLIGRRRSDWGVRFFLDVLKESGADLELSDEAGLARLDFLLEDKMGRRWSVFFAEETRDGFLLKASIERLVPFLLEMRGIAS